MAAVRFWINDGILIKGKLEGFAQYSIPENEHSGRSMGTETISVLKIISSFGLS